MTYKDRTLVCAQCNKEFVFSAGEQKFYAEKGLTSDPKRCKPCRDARRRQKKSRGDGIYRSPAFENSAPRHQKIRGRRVGPGRRGRGEYRSPGLNDRAPKRDEYRSPAFREYETIKPEDEYRSPAYREQENINPEEEYRAPGFQEHDDSNPNEDYRSPGFQDLKQKYVDEKPMFSITCAVCGKEAMVPVLPDEREETFCPECYAEKRRKERETKAAEEKDDMDNARAATGARSDDPEGGITEETESASENDTPMDSETSV